MAKKDNDNIADLIKNLKGFVRKGASSNVEDTIPTGHFNLDYILNHGESPENIDLNDEQGYDPSKCLGLPLGRVAEFFGEEGGGKSSLAYRVVGNAQKKNYLCAWIDTEQSWSDNLAHINGVNKDNLIFSDMSNVEKPDQVFYAEDVFNGIIGLIKGGIKVIVLDSVANLVPRVKMEGDAGQNQPGVLANLMSENIKKVVNYAGVYGSLVIFINQLREKIGVLFGSPLTTPGGRSLKHNSSIRLQITIRKSKDDNLYRISEDGREVLIGRKANVRIAKNRMSKPYLENIEIPIYFEAYFPDISEILFDFGRQLRLINVRKGVFIWRQGDIEHKIDGKDNFIKYIKENKFGLSLATELVNKSKEQHTIVPPEIIKWLEDNKDSVIDKKIKEDTLVKEETNNEEQSIKTKVGRPRKNKIS